MLHNADKKEIEDLINVIFDEHSINGNDKSESATSTWVDGEKVKVKLIELIENCINTM